METDFVIFLQLKNEFINLKHFIKKYLKIFDILNLKSL